jgi:hypothetical protein
MALVALRFHRIVDLSKTLKYSFLLSFILLLLLPVFALGQSSGGSIPPTMQADKGMPDDQHATGSLEEEMRAKRAIRYAENEHKGNLERAREVSQIGVKLKGSFLNKNTLDKEDGKRLNRLEKLAKQLRSKAGGSDSDTPLDKPPADLKSAIDRVAEASEALSKLVEKTPRQVVSASVIDEANVLLQLIELVRHFSKD